MNLYVTLDMTVGGRHYTLFEAKLKRHLYAEIV